MVFEQYIANDYLRALVVAAVMLIVIRIVVAIVLKAAKQFTSKTKTDVDDILFAKTSTPITIIIFLLAIEIPLNELPIGLGVSDTISKIILSLIVIVVMYLAYIFLDVVILRGWDKFSRKTKTKIDESLRSLVHETLKITIIVLAALYVLNLWGIEIGPLLAGLGIAGLAVALALQPVLSNIFSGVAMILDKSIKVGDLVYLDADTKGTVEKIGFRSTRIRTFDNELIIVPNNKVADGKIQNVGLPEPKSRAIVNFGVAYGADIEKVKKLIEKEISSIENVLDDPAPFVYFNEMADSSLNFRVYFYVNSFENRWRAVDIANTKIYKALNKAGIEIPFPQMDVHLKKEK